MTLQDIQQRFSSTVTTTMIACAAALWIPGCAPSSVTDRFGGEEDGGGDKVYYEEPAVCPVSITNHRGTLHTDSTVSVSYNIRNLTEARIMKVTVRTYFTDKLLVDNIATVAWESEYSDTTIDRMYLTDANELSVSYTPSGIKKNSGNYFFFEVRDVTFFPDSLVKGSGWFYHDGTVTLGGGQ